MRVLLIALALGSAAANAALPDIRDAKDDSIVPHQGPHVHEYVPKTTSDAARAVDTGGRSLTMDENLLVGVSPDGLGRRRLQASGWPELPSKLLGPDVNDGFARAVAMDGDTLAIGAPHEGALSGAVYIYKYDGTAWTNTAVILGSTATGATIEEDKFGHAVALSGGVLAVGATGVYANRVNIFRYQASTSSWLEEAMVQYVGTLPTDHQFGHSVALSGGILAVGIPFADYSDTFGDYYDTGAVHVFRHDGGTSWSFEQVIIKTVEFDNVGWSVALSGNVLVIGGNSGHISGAAYVFRYSGTWVEEQRLIPGDGVIEDYFGSSVAVDGDAIVVGAPSISRRNLAYVYRFDGVSSWSEEAKVLSDETFGDSFGSSVAIAGEVIAVGAPGKDEGSAYVFRFDSSTSQWPQDLKVLSDLSPGGDKFGTVVALSQGLSGEVLAVGDVGKQVPPFPSPGDTRGSVYVGTLKILPTPVPTPAPTSAPTPDPCAPTISLGFLVLEVQWRRQRRTLSQNEAFLGISGALRASDTNGNNRLSVEEARSALQKGGMAVPLGVSSIWTKDGVELSESQVTITEMIQYELDTLNQQQTLEYYERPPGADAIPVMTATYPNSGATWNNAVCQNHDTHPPVLAWTVSRAGKVMSHQCAFFNGELIVDGDGNWNDDISNGKSNVDFTDCSKTGPNDVCQYSFSFPTNYQAPSYTNQGLEYLPISTHSYCVETKFCNSGSAGCEWPQINTSLTVMRCTTGLQYDGTPADLYPHMQGCSGVMLSWLDTRFDDTTGYRIYKITDVTVPFVQDTSARLLREHLMQAPQCGLTHAPADFRDITTGDTPGIEVAYAVVPLDATGDEVKDKAGTTCFFVPWLGKIRVAVSSTGGGPVQGVTVKVSHIAGGALDVRYTDFLVDTTDVYGDVVFQVRVQDQDWSDPTQRFRVTVEKTSPSGFQHTFLPSPPRDVTVQHCASEAFLSFVDQSTVVLSGTVSHDGFGTKTRSNGGYFANNCRHKNAAGCICPVEGAVMFVTRASGAVEEVTVKDGKFSKAVFQGEIVTLGLSQYTGLGSASLPHQFSVSHNLGAGATVVHGAEPTFTYAANKDVVLDFLDISTQNLTAKLVSSADPSQLIKLTVTGPLIAVGAVKKSVITVGTSLTHSIRLDFTTTPTVLDDEGSAVALPVTAAESSLSLSDVSPGDVLVVNGQSIYGEFYLNYQTKGLDAFYAIDVRFVDGASAQTAYDLLLAANLDGQSVTIIVGANPVAEYVNGVPIIAKVLRCDWEKPVWTLRGEAEFVLGATMFEVRMLDASEVNNETYYRLPSKPKIDADDLVCDKSNRAKFVAGDGDDSRMIRGCRALIPEVKECNASVPMRGCMTRERPCATTGYTYVDELTVNRKIDQVDLSDLANVPAVEFLTVSRLCIASVSVIGTTLQKLTDPLGGAREYPLEPVDAWGRTEENLLLEPPEKNRRRLASGHGSACTKNTNAVFRAGDSVNLVFRVVEKEPHCLQGGLYPWGSVGVPKLCLGYKSAPVSTVHPTAIRVVDQISGVTTSATLSGPFTHTMTAKEVNLFAPFSNELTVEFSRTFDKAKLQFVRHAVVLGTIPEEVPQVWTAATSDTLIFSIIRRPPGGASTATLIEGSTISTSMAIAGAHAAEVTDGYDFGVNAGLQADSTVGASVGATVLTKVLEVGGTVGYAESITPEDVTVERASSRHFDVGISFSAGISTSDSPYLAGQPGDVIVGGGASFRFMSATEVFATQTPSSNPVELCMEVRKSSQFLPEKVTTYVMSVYEIEKLIERAGALLKDTQVKGINPTELENQISNWQKVLRDYRQITKSNAAESVSSMLSRELDGIHAYIKLFVETGDWPSIFSVYLAEGLNNLDENKQSGHTIGLAGKVLSALAKLGGNDPKEEKEKFRAVSLFSLDWKINKQVTDAHDECINVASLADPSGIHELCKVYEEIKEKLTLKKSLLGICGTSFGDELASVKKFCANVPYQSSSPDYAFEALDDTTQYITFSGTSGLEFEWTVGEARGQDFTSTHDAKVTEASNINFHLGGQVGRRRRLGEGIPGYAYPESGDVLAVSKKLLGVTREALERRRLKEKLDVPLVNAAAKKATDPEPDQSGGGPCRRRLDGLPVSEEEQRRLFSIGPQGCYGFEDIDSTSLAVSLSRASSKGSERSHSIAVSMKDDNMQDSFVVQVSMDPVYGTPVFKTLGGRSSCVGETGTTKRDAGVTIREIRPLCATPGQLCDGLLTCECKDLEAGKDAIFSVVFENRSPWAGDVKWLFRVVEGAATNWDAKKYTKDMDNCPAGDPGSLAIKTVDLVNLRNGDGLNISPLRYGQHEVRMKVSRPKFSPQCFSFTKIKLEIVALCEDTDWEGVQDVYQYRTASGNIIYPEWDSVAREWKSDTKALGPASHSAEFDVSWKVPQKNIVTGGLCVSGSAVDFEKLKTRLIKRIEKITGVPASSVAITQGGASGCRRRLQDSHSGRVLQATNSSLGFTYEVPVYPARLDAVIAVLTTNLTTALEDNVTVVSTDPPQLDDYCNECTSDDHCNLGLFCDFGSGGGTRKLRFGNIQSGCCRAR